MGTYVKSERRNISLTEGVSVKTARFDPLPRRNVLREALPIAKQRQVERGGVLLEARRSLGGWGVEEKAGESPKTLELF